MQAEVYLANKKELEAKLNQINMFGKGKKNTIIKRAAKESAKQMYTATKFAIPRRSGSLRKSLKLRMAKRSRVRVGVNIISTRKDLFKYVGSFQQKQSTRKKRKFSAKYGYSKSGEHIYYGGFVEYGTKYQKGSKAIKNTARAYAPAVIQDFGRRIIKMINDVVGKPTQKMLFDKFK